MTKLAFMGAGNMAQAIIGGLIENGSNVADIWAADPLASQLIELSNPVYHFGIKSVEHWFNEMNIYTTWDSLERVKGKPVCKWEIVVKPPLLFLRELLQGKAIVFGFRGFVQAALKGVMFFQILLKQYELTHHTDQDFMRIDS